MVLRGSNRWIGLQIDPKYDPTADSMKVTISETKDGLLPLGGPGTETETKTILGKDPGATAVVGAAFPSKDFVIPAFGGEVVLRSFGSNAFRYRHHPGSPPVARSGKTKMKRVKGKLKGLVFHEKPPHDAQTNARRTQQYLFRIIDGLEPLPTYGTSDEARFANAEEIQVDVREESDGTRVLLVAFPHQREPKFDDVHSTLLGRFAERLMKIDADDILVWKGKNDVHEVNEFWNGKKFVRPRGKLLKRIRGLFPEDY